MEGRGPSDRNSAQVQRTAVCCVTSNSQAKGVSGLAMGVVQSRRKFQRVLLECLRFYVSTRGLSFVGTILHCCCAARRSDDVSWSCQREVGQDTATSASKTASHACNSSGAFLTGGLEESGGAEHGVIRDQGL